MARPVARSSPAAALPAWIPPQLTQLVDAAPEGDQWLHEIKFDGYRMHARLDRGTVKLLTLTGLDWTHKYPPIAAAVASLGARQAYLDGELCGVFPDGITSFGMIQAASDAGDAAGLVFFIFDLLHLDGDDVGARPLIEHKALLATLLAGVAPPPALQAITSAAGVRRSTSRPANWSSRASSRNAPMPPTLPAIADCGSRSNACTARNLSWWARPIPREGGRGSARCLLAYHDPEGRLVYAGRAGVGIRQAELERLWRRALGRGARPSAADIRFYVAVKSRPARDSLIRRKNSLMARINSLQGPN